VVTSRFPDNFLVKNTNGFVEAGNNLLATAIYDRKGIDANRNGLLDDAEALHKKALQVSHDNSCAFNNPGVVRKEKKCVVSAEYYFRKSLEFYPECVVSVGNLKKIL